jgi:hypothetical protein
MIPAAVSQTATAAGRYLAGAPRRVSLDLPKDHAALGVTSAIYLAYTRDGILHYIGKVGRVSGTVGGRLAEHLRTSARKRSAWRTVWVVPLHNEIGGETLLAFERALIRTYRPPANIHHGEPAA